MIVNRLATNKTVPESQWSKGLSEIKNGGISRMLKKNFVGVKTSFTPSMEECDYRAKWRWQLRDAQLVREFAAPYMAEKKGLFTGKKFPRAKKALMFVKAQELYLVFDNCSLGTGQCPPACMLGVGELGISFAHAGNGELRKVFLPWEYFINRPIYLGPEWSEPAEYELPETYNIRPGDGCYVGDYMIFTSWETAQTGAITLFLQKLQAFLRSRCQTAACG